MHRTDGLTNATGINKYLKLKKIICVSIRVSTLTHIFSMESHCQYNVKYQPFDPTSWLCDQQHFIYKEDESIRLYLMQVGCGREDKFAY